MRGIRLALLLSAFLLPAGTAWPQTPVLNEDAKLHASDTAARHNFGWSVSLAGDTAVIGAPGHDANGGSAGAAYVFRFDGTRWIEEARLLPADGAPRDGFGRSVAVSGDVVVVGSATDDASGLASGSAYVFRFEGSDGGGGSDGTSWVQEAKLVPSDGAPNDMFFHVSVSGDLVAVGARGGADNGPKSGAAYIFRFDGTGWREEAKLVASDGAAGDFFGVGIAVSGDLAVIGAPYHEANGARSGAAYVFRFDGESWGEEAVLVPSDGAVSEAFGGLFGVALSGDVVAIGAKRHDGNGADAGAAYVFRFDGTDWLEEAILLASEGAAADMFGVVTLSGDTLVVGAPAPGPSAPGAAYVFRFDGRDGSDGSDGTSWVEEARLLGSDVENRDLFGRVSLSGGNVVVGARGQTNDRGNHAGATYIFRVSDEEDLDSGDPAKPSSLCGCGAEAALVPPPLVWMSRRLRRRRRR